MAELGILNVGAGDNKIILDPNDQAGLIRAARMIKDMIRRGYAILIEVDDGKGGKAHQRVQDFKEGTFEYIIADFDSAAADKVDQEEAPNEQSISGPQGTKKPKKASRILTRRVHIASTNGIAVARSAGG